MKRGKGSLSQEAQAVEAPCCSAWHSLLLEINLSSMLEQDSCPLYLFITVSSSAVQILKATDITINSALVSWNSVTGATGYRVTWGPTPGNRTLHWRSLMLVNKTSLWKLCTSRATHLCIMKPLSVHLKATDHDKTSMLTESCNIPYILCKYTLIIREAMQRN